MAEVLLSIKEVEVRRGMGIVLSEYDLEVCEGDILVITGENGSGKSTVIETAARLLPLEKGHISHHGQLTHHADGRRLDPVKPFGLTLQSNGVIGSETVVNHLQTVAMLSGVQLDHNALLESYNMDHRKADVIGHLSGGQARKVAVLTGLIPAMVSESPTLVLLDEPDAGLDDSAIDSLMDQITSLAAAGHGFLIASHNPKIQAIATKLHDLSTTAPGAHNEAKPWTPIGTKVEPRNTLFRTGHRYASSTHSGLARNGIVSIMVLGCLLALGDPANLSDGLWATGAILAPAFASGLVGDPTTYLLRENRAADWWRAQAQRTPAATGLGLIVGTTVTVAASYVMLGLVDLNLVLIGALMCEFAMKGVRFLNASTQRLSRPNAVFIRLLLPAFILPWALIVSWAAEL